MIPRPVLYFIRPGEGTHTIQSIQFAAKMLSLRQTKQKEPLMGRPARSNQARVPASSSRAAAGDIRVKQVRQVATAVADGAIAAINASM